MSCWQPNKAGSTNEGNLSSTPTINLSYQVHCLYLTGFVYFKNIAEFYPVVSVIAIIIQLVTTRTRIQFLQCLVFKPEAYHLELLAHQSSFLS